MIVTHESLNALLVQADREKQARIIGRALVVLFDRQTDEEKQVNDTRKHNMVGFCAADGKAGSLTAKYFLKHGTLTDWQVDKWMRRGRNGLPRLCKYAKQLNEVAEKKARANTISRGVK